MRNLCLSLIILALVGFVTFSAGAACTGSTAAHPDHALSTVIFGSAGTVNPQNEPVSVGACTNITIMPTLQVAAADVGKTATLICYVWMPNPGFGLNLPSQQTTLGQTAQYTILSNGLDFSAQGGLQFWVYAGYALSDGTIRYNAYSVTVAGGNTDGNQPPVADSLTMTADSSVPYLTKQLSASDPDNDILTYELISPTGGVGYSSAYINPQSGMLYVTTDVTGDTTINLSYRVTDGLLFSTPASVRIQVDYLSDNERNTGLNEVDPQTYASFRMSYLGSDLLGAPGALATQPTSMDLSANFPAVGDQGNQGSCVGWATAYALKTYHEKVEEAWALNTPGHLFSPAYVYNQINGGQDLGSYINEALDLAVSQGIATLATMPYSDTDYNTQPSGQARAEAAYFKANSWFRVNDTSQIKASIANRKPVVAGITVYNDLMNLQGGNSVYNTATGNPQGGHAVTIVGYDDNRYGGAFKFINSWGRSWGDNGYFWMPYSFAANGIMTQAYVLEDAENTGTPDDDTPDPSEPEPNVNTLPNLTVSSWDMDYDPRPGGAGTLTFRIDNNGTAIAPSGADVTLVLSSDMNISSNDQLVVYEFIPFDLAPGEYAYRDTASALQFTFPENLGSGTFYAALCVDTMDAMQEANENDNISLGNGTISLQNTRPDLIVNSWYADTFDYYGNGYLVYEVCNAGAAPVSSTDWYVNLILDPDQITGNGNEIFLFYETADFTLEPGNCVYRDWNARAYFNLYEDWDGYTVPSGSYYAALWVDDLNSVAESNEINNGSYSWGTFPVSNSWASTNTFAGAEQAATVPTMNAYNGRSLPANATRQGNGFAATDKDLIWKKVTVTRNDDGTVRVMAAEDNPQVHTGESIPQKTMSARARLIFPSTSGRCITENDN
ncbi:MAG: C39 family peptidase [Deltaproteobacteria bacterium]|nr:C39 family peptidase [Candidatus Anaeroferrophillacea bacterium]